MAKVRFNQIENIIYFKKKKNQFIMFCLGSNVTTYTDFAFNWDSLSQNHNKIRFLFCFWFCFFRLYQMWYESVDFCIYTYNIWYVQIKMYSSIGRRRINRSPRVISLVRNIYCKQFVLIFVVGFVCHRLTS